MDRSTYFKNQKVFFLYSATITCIIVGVLFHYGKLEVASNKVSSILATLFILAGYLLFLKIARRLKQKEIHGLTNIVWATYLLFSQGYYRSSLQGLFWSILQAVETVVLVYFLVDGIIRFIISLVDVIKAASVTGEKTIASVDTAIAIVTSLLAIIISIIEIL